MGQPAHSLRERRQAGKPYVLKPAMVIYLDHNATTPVDAGVLEAMLPYFSSVYGNPSSVHRYGRVVRAGLDRAREQVAALINAEPAQVIFTSGGTEANNLAVQGYTTGVAPAHLAISGIEHASVLEPARFLQASGWQVDVIPVDDCGRVTSDDFRATLTPATRLASVMMANNETGVLQDIGALSAIARQNGVIMHTDAVQALGKIPVDFKVSGVHMMSLSAHKLYGPKGVGALIVDKRLELRPLLHGGGQERGVRAGTENVAAIVGFGAAAQLALETLSERMRTLKTLRIYLEARLRELAGTIIFAAAAERLPNTVCIGVEGIDGETLLMQLASNGIAVSSGSACASASAEPSHVLTAMGVDAQTARSAIRISLGKDTTRESVDEFCRVLQKRSADLRGDIDFGLASTQRLSSIASR